MTHWDKEFEFCLVLHQETRRSLPVKVHLGDILAKSLEFEEKITAVRRKKLQLQKLERQLWIPWD